ncbi:purine and uridine phosphorylase [Aspergillus egyptiacus]|nr:purine and uridine phosphorylase [Aspergillus egyptiacus]
MPHAEYRQLQYGSYTVALICPLKIELQAARGMLDEEHEPLPRQRGDPNTYVLGTMSGHNVVLTSLPADGYVPTASVAVNLIRTFTQTKLCLLVGIGGGVPSMMHDIRLGDVVVSDPRGTTGGVIQYDYGKATVHGFKLKGQVCPPPEVWRAVVDAMNSNHRTRPNRIGEFISDMRQRNPRLRDIHRPPPETDVLFDAGCVHVTQDGTCADCDTSMAIVRPQRASPHESKIHYGLIASGDRIIRNGVKRDELARQAGGALCFETEAAGVMVGLRCMVIRGIADYCDSHKNNDWNGYAAAAAAALAKEILTYVRPGYM